jgi:ATP-binding cassette subfamily B (MDR/TAP) protein 1
MEPIQAIPGNANSLIGARLPDDATDRHLLDDSEPEERNSNSTYQDLQWDRPVDHTSASLHQTARKIPPSHPKFLRQILGLNPFKTSYFALFRSLDDLQSRCILFLGIILAVAAGVPLPLIGVIFGKIINNFPPNEDDLRIRLIELMGIAVAFFVVTWGWSVCWGVVGERVTRKMREKLVERTLGMDQAYFDTVSPDLTNILTEKTQTIQLGTSEKVGLFISSISYFVTAFTVGFILNAKLTGVL